MPHIPHRGPAVAGLVLAVSLAVAGLGAPTASAAGRSATGPTERTSTARQQAAAALSSHPKVFRATADDRFTPRGTPVVDRDGTAYVRFDRSYRGLPVIGGDVVVQVAPDGGLAGRSLTLAKPLDVATAARVSRSAAARTARSVFTGSVDSVTARKVVDASGGAPALAWEVTVSGVRPDQTPSVLHVLVDAASGAVRSSADDVKQATGYSIYSGQVSISTSGSPGAYQMSDPTRGNTYTTDLMGATSGSGTTFTDADDVWGNGSQSDRASAGVDAHYGAQTTFDYFKNVLGRDGIFDNGTGVRSRVHYGNTYVNAFWDGTQMTYGDGASNAKPLVSLDIAGHEMSHGVTENTANLTYSGESGGLNEATSDIFGTTVEFYANNPSDVGDYLIGEKVDINGDGTPLRYMDRPSRDGASRDCWSSGLGSLDVHYSSGPANHAFYLMSEGSGAKIINGVSYDSPTCDGSTVAPIGRDAAARIWYRALSVYMTASTNYAGARTAAVKAATDLYGADSTQCAGVEQAFSAIAVAGTTCGTAPPPPDGNLITNPGFESGVTAWSQTAGVITNDSTRARTGSWLGWLNGYGRKTTDTLSQSVTIPSAASATLSLYVRIATSETGGTVHDRLKVRVVSGTKTKTLATYSNLNASSDYVLKSFNFSSYVGKTVTIKLVGTEDSSYATSFFVDDFSLTTG